jgi:hypothetical protein
LCSGQGLKPAASSVEIRKIITRFYVQKGWTSCTDWCILASLERSKQMTPTKIILEKTATHIQLRVFAPQTAKGSIVVESVPFKDGKSLPTIRKSGTSYAKRFSIPFIDKTA